MIFLLSDDTGESMMIRGCAVDSGTLTTDTEIIRMSHCGAFYFNERSEFMFIFIFRSHTFLYLTFWSHSDSLWDSDNIPVRVQQREKISFEKREENTKRTLTSLSVCRYVRGCVQSCSDVDGCNGGHVARGSLLLAAGLTVIVTLQ